jgi:uncharacterized protein YheU (UPF0270 family)
MRIPIDQLAPETLRLVVEEYVSREGTDYGVRTTDFADKVEQVLRLLKNDKAFLCFDTESESCQILSPEAFRSAYQQPKPAAEPWVRITEESLDL